jgi:hypothetical protein
MVVVTIVIAREAAVQVGAFRDHCCTISRRKQLSAARAGATSRSLRFKGAVAESVGWQRRRLRKLGEVSPLVLRNTLGPANVIGACSIRISAG